MEDTGFYSYNFFKKALILVLFFCVLLFSNQAHAKELIIEDFDSYIAGSLVGQGDWTIDPLFADASARISNDQSNSTPNSLVLSYAEGSHLINHLNEPTEEGEVGYISFRANLSELLPHINSPVFSGTINVAHRSGGYRAGYVYCFIPKTLTEGIFALSYAVNCSNPIIVKDGIELNKWNEYVVKIDLTKHEITASVNGGPFSSPLYTVESGHIVMEKSMQLSGAGKYGNKIFLDDFGFCNNGECIHSGYSSVIFLPGIEASKLYTLKDGKENRLWDTLSKEELLALAMDPLTGRSLDTNVYTKDILIEDSYIHTNYYKSFIDNMNALVGQGLINDFVGFPYDWRKSVPEIVAEPVKMPNGSYNMISELEGLAAGSRTGQVTLIGHSMGGQVIKELLRSLEQEGKVGLVDKAILVASPQLGTPNAVEVALHGMSFGYGILDRATVREASENMKSLYGLMLREKYFEKVDTVTQPIIEFGEGVATEQLRNTYGDSIETYAGLKDFLLGSGYRIEPSDEAVDEPNVLKSHLLEEVLSGYEGIDQWTPPEGLRVIEIIGWGLNTVRGIRYETIQKKVCDNGICLSVPMIDPRPLITSEGDGTVVYASAGVMNGEKYYVDIHDYNADNYIVFPDYFGKDHASILEASNLITFLNQVIVNQHPINLPEYITTDKPVKNKRRLQLSVHSPVELHIYDINGLHTGPIPNPDPENQMDTYEERIPNSYYWHFGEGQYAGLGVDEVGTVKLVGTGVGTFDFEIEELLGDEVVGTHTFENIPAREGMVAELELASLADVLELNVDFDGDGTAEVAYREGESQEVNSLMLLKELIKSYELRPRVEAKLLSTVKKILKFIEKREQQENAQKDLILKTSEEFIKEIEKFEKQGQLTNEQAFDLVNIVEDIMSNVVE